MIRDLLKQYGFFNVTVTAKLEDIVKVGLKKFTFSSKEARGLQLVSIDSVQKNVVEDVCYHFHVVLRDGDIGKPMKCQLRVWYLRNNKKEEPDKVEVDCKEKNIFKQSVRPATFLNGEWISVNDHANDPRVHLYLSDALRYYNEGKYGGGYSVKEIIKATYTEQPDFIYQIDVVIKNEEKEKRCMVKALILTWKEKITVSCLGEDVIESPDIKRV